MKIREIKRKEEKYAKLLLYARLFSELTIVIGFMILIFIVLRNIV